MAHWLNKKYIILILSSFLGGYIFSQQEGVLPPVYKDYKDQDQFEKFRKRRMIVGSWQINALKEEGAIVVKLKTGKLLIDQLIKQGNEKLAVEKQLEQFAINRNTMFAFMESLTFCKVYFMYSNYNDSLLNGSRQGIFLDTNLNIDPKIIMTEKYYILVENDFAYNSSIGFVKEDSARFIKETGNPIRQMSFVLKNKYGHQLKSPMPYATFGLDLSATSYEFPIKYSSSPNGATSIWFAINKTFLLDLKKSPASRIIKKQENDIVLTSVRLKKEQTFEKLRDIVAQLNYNLNQVYKENTKPDPARLPAEIKSFLY